jgi:hypothetical protein
MKRVYIAGAYSADNVISVLGNIRNGIRGSVETLMEGYAVFCPWIDFQFSLALREDETLTVEDYYNYSMAWLEVSDALLILPGWEQSVGTKAEIARAKELNIPVFYELIDLKKYEWPEDTALEYLHGFFDAEIKEIANVFWMNRESKNDSVQPEFMQKSNTYHLSKALKHIGNGMETYIDPEANIPHIAEAVARLIICMKKVRANNGKA